MKYYFYVLRLMLMYVYSISRYIYTQIPKMTDVIFFLFLAPRVCVRASV